MRGWATALQSVDQALAVGLDNEHFEVREEAAALRLHGGGALPLAPALIRQLGRAEGRVFEATKFVNVAIAGRSAIDRERVRNASRSALVAIGEPVVQLIVSALGSSTDPVAKEDMLVVLGQSGVVNDARVEGALRRAATDSVASVRVRAMDAIDKLYGERHTKGFVLELAADRGESSACAASALARCVADLGEIIEPLITAVQSADEQTRLAAAITLARLRSTHPAFISGLLRVLGDGELDERILATRLLGCLARKVPEVATALVGRPSDDSSDVREAAIRSLGRIAHTNDQAFQSLSAFKVEGQSDAERSACERAIITARRRRCLSLGQRKCIDSN